MADDTEGAQGPETEEAEASQAGPEASAEASSSAAEEAAPAPGPADADAGAGAGAGDSVAPPESPAEAPPAAGAGPRTEAAAPPAGAQAEEAPDVYAVLRFCLSLLVEQAWVHLGLHVPEGGTEARLDLPRARVAIDSADALYARLKPAAHPEEQRHVEVVLANLRVNYAKKADAG